MVSGARGLTALPVCQLAPRGVAASSWWSLFLPQVLHLGVWSLEVLWVDGRSFVTPCNYIEAHEGWTQVKARTVNICSKWWVWGACFHRFSDQCAPKAIYIWKFAGFSIILLQRKRCLYLFSLEHFDRKYTHICMLYFVWTWWSQNLWICMVGTPRAPTPPD